MSQEKKKRPVKIDPIIEQGIPFSDESVDSDIEEQRVRKLLRADMRIDVIFTDFLKVCVAYAGFGIRDDTPIEPPTDTDDARVAADKTMCINARKGAAAFAKMHREMLERFFDWAKENKGPEAHRLLDAIRLDDVPWSWQPNDDPGAVSSWSGDVSDSMATLRIGEESFVLCEIERAFARLIQMMFHIAPYARQCAIEHMRILRTNELKDSLTELWQRITCDNHDKTVEEWEEDSLIFYVDAARCLYRGWVYFYERLPSMNRTVMTCPQ